MKEKDQLVLSPTRQELFNSSRGSLAAGKPEQDDGDADTACSRALRRRAQAARKRIPESLSPFLDLLLKQPDRILATSYSLRISRIFLWFSSIALIMGRNSMAFFLSGMALLVFREAKRISQCIFLNRWLWLSGSAMLASLISFVALTLSIRERRKDVSAHLWLGGYLLQKLSGWTLGHYMYRHVESLHFLEIHVTILEGRNLATNAFSSIYSRRIRTTSSVIDIYHGSAKLARTNNHERKHFRFAVLSTSLGVYKEIDCRLLAPNQSSELGIAKVAIPEMRNVKMVNLFDILDENSNSRGQLLVEIEIRPQSAI
jgi:hypothetical protein